MYRGFVFLICMLFQKISFSLSGAFFLLAEFTRLWNFSRTFTTRLGRVTIDPTETKRELMEAVVELFKATSYVKIRLYSR